MRAEHAWLARSWAKQTLKLKTAKYFRAGAFPSRGEYEHVFTLEKVSRTNPARGDFVQLTPTIAEHLCRMIEVSRSKPQQQSREKGPEFSRSNFAEYSHRCANRQ